MPLLVVDIDLCQADLSAFDGYEVQVLTLLPQFGGRIERRLRTNDNRREFHILHFDDEAGFAAFLASAERAGLQAAFPDIGAKTKAYQVHET